MLPRLAWFSVALAIACTCPPSAAQQPPQAGSNDIRAEPALHRPRRFHGTLELPAQGKHRPPFDRRPRRRGDARRGRQGPGYQGPARRADPARRLPAPLGVSSGPGAKLPGHEGNQRATDQLRGRAESGRNVFRSCHVAEGSHKVAGRYAFAATVRRPPGQCRRELSPRSAGCKRNAAQWVRSLARGVPGLRPRRPRARGQWRLAHGLHLAGLRGKHFRLLVEGRRAG